MKYLQSVKLFEDSLRSEHRSPSTIRVYTLAIRQYLREFHTFSTCHLDRYKELLLSRYRPQTVNQRICAVNRYMDFMRTSPDAETAAHFQALRNLKQVKLQQRSFLDRNLSSGDFSYLKTMLRQENDLRWYYILRLLSATGARVSEFIQLKYEHLEAGHMDIFSKAGKMRRILIPHDLCLEAAAYYRSIGIKSGFIIRNSRGGVITPRGMNFMLKTFAARYRLDEKAMHPHAFRHLYAQNFLKKCPDISLLADLLGHDSIETTRIYLKKTSSEQQKLVDRLVTW